MEHNAYNELTAAYALDALDEADVRSFEEHLSGCSECQDDVAALSATAVALAYAAPPMDPPPALRGRILEAVAAERTSAAPEERADVAPPGDLPDNVARDARRNNVVPLRPRMRRPGAYLAAGLAIAACLVIGLGIWNVSLHNQLDNSRQALQTAPLQGANGSVVVGAGSKGVLVVSNLVTAPAGKTYEAWVIQDGKAVRAGTFDGGGTVSVRLEQPVPSGAVVAVTIEHAGGTDQPTSTPIITSSPI